MLDTIGGEKIAVPLGAGENNQTGLIRLNEVGAFLWEKLMLFSFADMAASQHCRCISAGLFAINCLDRQSFCIICHLGTCNAFDTFDALLSDLFDGQFTFTSNTDDKSFFSVYTMFFDQLVKAVCITWF